MLKKVYDVSEVSIKLLRKDEHHKTLLIIATGTVTSLGWSEPVLIPYYYFMPPKNGIYEFDFVAKTPSQPSSSVMTPIDVTFIWEDIPKELEGVQVNATNNSKLVTLDEKLDEITPICIWHRPGF
jgi:hypothetical protein